MVGSLFRFFLVLVQCTILVATPVSAQEFKDYGKGSKIVKQAKISLKSGQAKGFRLFRKNAAYFGAMAINKNRDVVAWFRHFNSLEAVRYTALLNCQEQSKDIGAAPSDCVLYASIIPKSLNSSTHKAKGFPEKLHDYEQRYRQEQRPGLFGAHATSDAGGGGFSEWKSTEQAATKLALKTCEIENKPENLIMHYDMHPRALRRLMKEGWYDCYIVDVYRP